MSYLRIDLSKIRYDLTPYEKELIDNCKNGKITLFRGQTNELSHFYQCNIDHQGITYSSVEQAYQAYKALFFNDMRKFFGLIELV